MNGILLIIIPLDGLPVAVAVAVVLATAVHVYFLHELAAYYRAAKVVCVCMCDV